MATPTDLEAPNTASTANSSAQDGFITDYGEADDQLRQLGKRLPPKDFFHSADRRTALENMRLGLQNCQFYMSMTPLSESGQVLLQNNERSIEKILESWHENWRRESTNPPLPKSGFTSENTGPFIRAWKGPFQRTGAYRAFKEKVKECATAEKGRYYARIIPIVQSSGVGKSRMLDEVAKSVFTLPICLRPPGGNGYPAGDEAAFHLLCDRLADQRTVFAFITRLLEHTLSVVEARPEMQKASEWRTYLQSCRRQFYDAICQKARMTVAQAKKHDQKVSSEELVDLTDHIFTLLEKLSLVVEGGYLVVYIDEAQALTQYGHGAMLSYVMSSMVELAGQKGLALVLMSTNLQLSTLAPDSGSILSGGGSWRSSETPQHSLVQPWTYFPFKIFPIAPPGGEPWTPQRARSFGPSANLGRPLWAATLRETKRSELSEIEEEMKALAFDKLNLGRVDGEEPMPNEALKAALVCRLAIGIERTVAGFQFASRLVAKRMAVAHFVDKSRSFMAASYPVDPVLAWAAFQTMQLHSSKVIAKALSEMTESGLIERGPRGELVTKFALMRAYDVALVRKYGIKSFKDPNTVKEIPHFSAVSLGELLTAFSGRPSIMDDLDIFDTKPLRELMACDLVLAQWIQCHGKQASVGTRLALQALFTHCGLQMPFNFPGVDHMLVACRDATQSISKSNMVIVMLQSKNRNQIESFDMKFPLLRHFSEQGVPVVFILHEVAPEHQSFNMERDSKLSTNAQEKRTAAQGGDGQQGDVWCLSMEGVHPDLLEPAAITRLVQAQSNPFVGRGDITEQAIIELQPMLTAEEGLTGPLYEEAANYRLFD